MWALEKMIIQRQYSQWTLGAGLQAVLWLVQVSVLLVHLSKIIHHNGGERPLLNNVKNSDLDPLFFLSCYCVTQGLKDESQHYEIMWGGQLSITKAPQKKKKNNPPAAEDNRAFCLPHCQWHSAELLLIMACFSSEPSAFIRRTLFSTSK